MCTSAIFIASPATLWTIARHNHNSLPPVAARRPPSRIHLTAGCWHIGGVAKDPVTLCCGLRKALNSTIDRVVRCFALKIANVLYIDFDLIAVVVFVAVAPS